MRHLTMPLAVLLSLMLGAGGLFAAQAEAPPANDEQRQDEARPETNEEQAIEEEAVEEEAIEQEAIQEEGIEEQPEPREAAEERPALGVRLHPFAPGVVITEVIPDSPAAKAGLRTGDRIMMMNDRRYLDTQSFIAGIGRLSKGEEVNLHVQRNGQMHQVTVELKEFGEIYDAEEAEDDGIRRPRQVLRPPFDARTGDMHREIQSLREQVQTLQQQVEQLQRQVGVEATEEPADPQLPAEPAPPPVEAEPDVQPEAPEIEEPPAEPEAAEPEDDENDNEEEKD